MQTPGHAIINLAILGSLLPTVPYVGLGIILGAVIPDIPIVILYTTQHYLHKTPDDEIWAVHYQKPFWLNLIHGAHSLPISLAGALCCAVLAQPAGVAFFASMFGHALLDLPVHNRDAHRHFLPISQYRFESPYSYWDPKFHGAKVALVEIGLVLAASTQLRDANTWGFVALIMINIAYIVHYIWAFMRPTVQISA